MLMASLDEAKSAYCGIEPLILPTDRQGDNYIFLPSDEPVKCLLCTELFLMDDTSKFLKHLLTEHKFIIADLNLIADFRSYIEYWRKRFQQSLFTEFCSIIKTNSDKSDKGANEFCYLLCDALPEDREIRESLQQKRLQYILYQQHKERTDECFSRGCLFCRKMFENRTEFFTHLAHVHNFRIGAPDNIVFGNELVDILEEKIKNLQCLYCEKVFKDWLALKEHMRKKQHKKINPKNTTYDKFYVINYLEMGKNWEAVHNDDDIYSEDSEADEWEDWKEENPGATCLFCDMSSGDYEQLQLHMNETHGFDLNEVKEKLDLGFYQKVKLINYIRKKVHYLNCIFCEEKFQSRKELLNHMSETRHISEILYSKKWDQPEYYFPTYENDNLLCVLDDNSDEDDDNNEDTKDCLVLPEEKNFSEDCCLRDKSIRESLL